MKEIEDAMIALHSQAKKEKETAASSVAEKPSKQDQHASSAQHVSDTRQPFARFDQAHSFAKRLTDLDDSTCI